MTVKENDTPVPVSREALVNIDAEGNIIGHISFAPGPPREEQRALGLWVNGEVIAHVNWGFPLIPKSFSFVSNLMKRIRNVET